MQIIFGTFAIIISFIYACFSALFGFLFPNPEVIAVRENLDMNIKPYYVEFHEDTHGGFHGDGEEIIIFTPNDAQIYKIYHQWQKTPIDSEIAPFLFCEEEYNGIDLREYVLNTDGWWFYKNRNIEAVYSHNFSFAFFDGEKVYYYELDT